MSKNAFPVQPVNCSNQDPSKDKTSAGSKNAPLPGVTPDEVKKAGGETPLDQGGNKDPSKDKTSAGSKGAPLPGVTPDEVKKAERETPLDQGDAQKPILHPRASPTLGQT
jgi:hypothetical protein